MNPNILLCTVGTSLLNHDNFGGKRTQDGITDWNAISADLAETEPTNCACGAEINSVASLISQEYVPGNAGIYLFHSDTEAGRQIANVLSAYYLSHGHSPVQAIPVIDLHDDDPKRFRTKGLRNLAKAICGKVREHSAPACAINATGGYKAQIAIAVLLGQTLSIPVYYMHERFSEIIPFPPMPVALDFQVWMRASGLLATLERDSTVSKALFMDDWDEKYESLVNTESIDGTEYLELSPTGEIFHETFRERFRTARDQVLPPAAVRKLAPVLHDHSVINQIRVELLRYLTDVTQAVPAVVRCITNYCHPQLNEPTRFRSKGEEVEGIYTDGTCTVKFKVETTATTPGQRDAVVAALNEWVQSQ
jgi:putative CRISPR-associated protein (TIGR02619 family)